MKQPSVRLVGFSLVSLVASDRGLPQVSQVMASSGARGGGDGDNSGSTACCFVSEFVELLVGE